MSVNAFTPANFNFNYAKDLIKYQNLNKISKKFFFLMFLFLKKN